MKPKRTLFLSTLLVILAGLSFNAFAENNAYCEVKKDGEKSKKATGHCSFSDQGDSLTLRLANGDEFEMHRKGNKKNQFKDQKGRPVHRDENKKGEIKLKWEHRHVTVIPDKG